MEVWKAYQHHLYLIHSYEHSYSNHLPSPHLSYCISQLQTDEDYIGKNASISTVNALRHTGSRPRGTTATDRLDRDTSAIAGTKERAPWQ